MDVARIHTRTTTRSALRWLPLVVATLALGAPASASARSCSAPKYPGSGYFTSLKATGTSCATGRKVTLAHYRCRVRSGVKGRCSRSVLRYRCTERRTSIPTQINARVTCRRGRATVIYTYQQNT
jgi:hypothetical protein